MSDEFDQEHSSVTSGRISAARQVRVKLNMVSDCKTVNRPESTRASQRESVLVVRTCLFHGEVDKAVPPEMRVENGDVNMQACVCLL